MLYKSKYGEIPMSKLDSYDLGLVLDSSLVQLVYKSASINNASNVALVCLQQSPMHQIANAQI